MDNLIRNYFINKLKKENFGQIENADLESRGSICDNPNGDIVSIFINVNDGKIADIKMECGPCDPAAIVATNIAVDILKGMDVKEIIEENSAIYDQFNKIIGGESRQGIKHLKNIVEQVKGLLGE